MYVHLDLNMTMKRPLDGLQQVRYLKEFQDTYKEASGTCPGQPGTVEAWQDLPLA